MHGINMSDQRLPSGKLQLAAIGPSQGQTASAPGTKIVALQPLMHRTQAGPFPLNRFAPNFDAFRDRMQDQGLPSGKRKLAAVGPNEGYMCKKSLAMTPAP